MRSGSRSRAVAVLAVAVTAAWLLAGCSSSSGQPSARPYAATDLRTGKAVDVTEFSGDVLLLSGWATWCPPCREELPALESLYRERRDEGLRVIAVNLDSEGPTVRDVLPVVEQLSLTMPQWVDRENLFRTRFKAVSMPTNVLIGRDGALLHTWHGAIDLEDPDTRRIIDEALTAPPAQSR